MNSSVPPTAASIPLARHRLGPGAPPGEAGSDAFDSLFREEWGRVMRVAWRTLGDAAAAEDVAQEAFLALHQRHPKGMPGASAWLHLAAAHLALNRLRGDRRRDRRERSVQETSQPADPEGEALATETRREVNAALARIPRRQAALLALRYSGLSYSEVAAALGLRVNQVGTRLRRAEAALLKEMERDHSHAPG